MSVLWMDDCSFYKTADLSVRYQTTTGVTVSAGTGRFGTNSFHYGGANTQVRRSLSSSIATGTLAFSFKFASLPASNTQIMAFYDSGTVQVDLRITPTGALIVTRNGTQIGSTSTNLLNPNVWYRIEFQATIDPSAGVIEVHVDGSSSGWIPSTGSLNTRNTANSSFNQANWGNNAVGANITADFNDVVCTDSNSPNAGFLGDKRIFLRLQQANSSVTWTPTFASFLNSHAYVLGEQFKDSNGNVQQCTTAGTSASSGTPTWATTGGSTTTSGTATFTVVGSGSNPGAQNWMAVSESAEDGDSSYNADSNPGDIDLFTYANLPAGAQNIAAVDNVVFARKDDAGTRQIQSWMSSSGTTQGSSTVTLSTTYQFVDLIQETDPHTSSAWTASGVNALLVGYKEIT